MLDIELDLGCEGRILKTHAIFSSILLNILENNGPD